MSSIKVPDKLDVKIKDLKNIWEQQYNWIIPHFDIKKTYLQKIEIGGKIKCTLTLYPTLEDRFNHDRRVKTCARFFFTQLPNDCEYFFKFLIIASNKYEICTFSHYQKIVLCAEGFDGSSHFLTSQNFMHFLQNNSLNLDIIITIKNAKKNGSDNLGNEYSTLQSDMGRLYKRLEFFSDFVFATADNQKVPTHKALLAARSPVFAKIFQDNQTDFLEMKENVSKPVLMEFLRFLYCNTVENLNAFGVELLKLSIKYEIPSLAKLCEHHEMKNVKKKMENITKKIQNLEGMKSSELVAKVVMAVDELDKIICDSNL